MPPPVFHFFPGELSPSFLRALSGDLLIAMNVSCLSYTEERHLRICFARPVGFPLGLGKRSHVLRSGGMSQC